MIGYKEGFETKWRNNENKWNVINCSVLLLFLVLFEFKIILLWG